MDIVIASHSKPRWPCHHCICPEKQLLHQKDWLHGDSGHFLWDFLRFFVWEIASSPAPNLFSITFSEKKKKSMKIFDLKVDRWKWCHSPSAFVAAWDSHWHDPSRAKQHPPRKWRKCLGWNCRMHWNHLKFEFTMTFWILHMKQMWLAVSPAALSRCGKSNPRWHSCWRSYHLSNLPKRALCSGNFCIRVFPTSALSERIHQLESKATILQDAAVEDARNVITLKQWHACKLPYHTPTPHHSSFHIHHHPPGTSTKESAKRMNSALALRSSGVAMATNVISCSEPNSVKVHRRIDRMASESRLDDW